MTDVNVYSIRERKRNEIAGRKICFENILYSPSAVLCNDRDGATMRVSEILL